MFEISCHGSLFFLVDFADLFPDRDIMFGDFTIITISQKTKEDMTGWSEDVEVEREELLKTVCAKMGLVTREPVFGFSLKACFKPVYSATETS